MTKEYEQRGYEEVERESFTQSPPAPREPDPRVRISTRRAAHKPYNRMQKRAAEVGGVDRERPRPESGSGACKLATGAAAHAPLGLVVVWPLGTVDPRERRWAAADEAGDLIRRAGCRSPKDEGRLLPAALRRASRLPELYCELGRGGVLATSRPRRALPPPSQRAGPRGAQAMSCGGGR